MPEVGQESITGIVIDMLHILAKEVAITRRQEDACGSRFD